jgi:hypothetical protein
LKSENAYFANQPTAVGRKGLSRHDHDFVFESRLHEPGHSLDPFVDSPKFSFQRVFAIRSASA